LCGWEFKNKNKITILVITRISVHESSLIPKVCAMYLVTITANEDSVSGLCANLVQYFS